MADGDHDVIQAMQASRVVEHATRRHDGKLHVVRDIQQCPRRGEISTHTVALNLHEKPLLPEDGLAVLREPAGGIEPLRLEGSRQQPIAAGAGENDQPVVTRFERGERQSRIEPLGAQVGLRQQATEIRVALRSLRKQHDMTAITECDFGAGDRLHAERLRGVRECERAVDAVAVGEGDGGVSEPMRFSEELVGWGGSIEKRIG